MIRKAAEQSVEVREKMRGGAGAVTVRQFFKPEEITAKTRLCARLSIPPGAGIGLHQHLQEDEIYIVLQGTGLLDDGQGEKQISAGDAILTGKGESHAVRNNGTENLEIIAVIMIYPA